MGVPFSPECPTDAVALVHVAAGSDLDALAQGLQALFEGCAVANLYSPDFYSYINR